ncbi:MAG: response regulator [Planctomycetes bacterium]|nr:response regulator [Planctomycetota bacterium]
MLDTDPNRHILLADDEPGIRDSLGRYLEQASYEVTFAADGYEALDCMERQRFFLVLTDIMMPKLNGLELLAHVHENFPGTDVIMITGNLDADYAIEALRHGAHDYFQKPLHYDEVLITVERVREKQRLKRTEREMNTLKAAAYETVIGFVQAVEEKDRDTKGHSLRVSVLTEELGRALDLDDAALVTCRYAGLLHDVGKIGIPESILNKPAALTGAEFAIVRNHAIIGARILEPITFLQDVATAIRSHHENWDGTGYPDRLAGEAIPRISRLVRLADVYDGLAMDRPYRGAVPAAEVRDYIAAHAGSLFDPEIARVFIDDVMPAGALTLAAV